MNENAQQMPPEDAPPPERHGQVWSVDEEQKLYYEFVAGISTMECAVSHQRTTGGIRAHLREMGLTDEEDNPISPRPEFTPTPAAQKRKVKAATALEKKLVARTESALTPAPEFNERFRDALHIMANTDASAFITGKAGSGKSTLLTWFSRNTDKNLVILAPTGVAALNVGGQTIHSFFRFSIDVTPQKILTRKKARNEKLYKKLQTIIIDEVSMVRADLLDCVEAFLRRFGPKPGEPFGGVQMIFIGDLYQLPPVVTSQESGIFDGHYETPYFFSAHAMRNFPLEMIELEKVYRQKDPDFVDLLNRVRNNSATERDITRLNTRFVPGPVTTERAFTITLTATNKRADDINAGHLAALKGKMYQSAAKVEGDFGREYFPTATELYFKAGAQIMMLNNDSAGRWVNGTLGTIEEIKRDEVGDEYLLVRLHDKNQTVEVYRHAWEVYKFSLAENQILSEPAGTFTQYPFRLAWAVTIHKSQGKTFEHVTIDVGSGTFAAGQMYVALSRCTSFEGIILKTPVKPQFIRTDPRIFSFLTTRQIRRIESAPPKDDTVALIERAIRDEALLDIVYLKADDTKTARTVRPLTLGGKTHQGKAFMGMKALCIELNKELLFSVDRILEIKKTGT